MGAEASEVTEAEFVKLWKLGALPNTITFQLRRRNAGDAAWVDVTGPTIPATFDLSSARTDAEIIKALKDMKAGVQYSYLPKWVNGSKKEVEIEYCFKETMDWGNGKTTVLQFKAEANTMETEITGDSHITPEVTQKPTGGGTLGAYWNTYETQYDFTNTIPVRQLEVHKYWADGNNQDGIRPGLTITVTRDGGVGKRLYLHRSPE